MALGGGSDRSWLEPLDERGRQRSDGSVEYDDLIGGHSGNCSGLNVENPDPDMVYIWERNTTQDLRVAAMKGGIIVTDDMPERASMKRLSETTGFTLDSANVYQDVVLVKYPAERVRQQREAEQKMSQAMLRSGSDEFLDKVTAAEREFDPRSRGTRFAMSDHRIQTVDERTQQVLDSWTPEKGITR